MWLSKVMSWLVITTELSLAGGFLFMESPAPVVWLGISFHSMLLVLTGYTFGMFYYATASSYLAFLEWPVSPIVITGRKPSHKLLQILEKLDFDNLLRFTPDPVQQDSTPRRTRYWNGVQVVVKGKSYQGVSGIYILLLYSPLTYFTFATLLSIAVPGQMILRRMWAIIFLAFVSPALLSGVHERCIRGTAVKTAS